MAGMDANLTIAQAKVQQDRTSHDNQMHQGPKKKSMAKCDELCTKVSHQGK